MSNYLTKSSCRKISLTLNLEEEKIYSRHKMCPLQIIYLQYLSENP